MSLLKHRPRLAMVKDPDRFQRLAASYVGGLLSGFWLTFLVHHFDLPRTSAHLLLYAIAAIPFSVLSAATGDHTYLWIREQLKARKKGAQP